MTTLEAFEGLRKALDELAVSIADTTPFNYILDALPHKIQKYIRQDTLTLFAVEFAIVWMVAVFMADFSLWILGKL